MEIGVVHFKNIAVRRVCDFVHFLKNDAIFPNLLIAKKKKYISSKLMSFTENSKCSPFSFMSTQQTRQVALVFKHQQRIVDRHITARMFFQRIHALRTHIGKNFVSAPEHMR